MSGSCLLKDRVHLVRRQVIKKTGLGNLRCEFVATVIIRLGRKNPLSVALIAVSIEFFINTIKENKNDDSESKKSRRHGISGFTECCHHSSHRQSYTNTAAIVDRAQFKRQPKAHVP